MTERITVTPERNEWVVTQESSPAQHRFHSGQTAEAMARQLGGALAVAGTEAEVRVYLRDGSLAGRFVCPAPRRWQALRAPDS